MEVDKGDKEDEDCVLSMLVRLIQNCEADSSE